uniref:Uncharacterized protein n=1 Tax=Arundo donax TaxID=35708 RepID=A0A0A8ZU85_ARUDO
MVPQCTNELIEWGTLLDILEFFSLRESCIVQSCNNIFLDNGRKKLPAQS